jgi:S-adenosylmethionine hydrolase
MPPRPSGIVTFLTDFGHRDPYAGVVKGALLRVHAKATIVDLGHDVPPQDVTAGAFHLAAAIGHFPVGSVHVAVVDPGVSTRRRLLGAAAHECFWLAPDNGVLALVLARDPDAEVRALDPEHLGLRGTSRTFHGRDVLAPIAGWLANGRYGFTALGPRIDDWVRGEDLFAGAPRIVHVDGYGNLISNVTGAVAAGSRLVHVGGHTVPIRGTYGDVPPGELVAVIGSYDLLEIAQNGGNAAVSLGLQRGAPIRLVGA